MRGLVQFELQVERRGLAQAELGWDWGLWHLMDLGTTGLV